MTHPMSHPAARAATAIVSMAVFGAVFFDLAAGSVLAVALLCLLTLSAVLWTSRRTRRAITAAIAAVESEPRPLLATAIDSSVSLPPPAWSTR
jgi:hypothetical protein